MAEFIESYCDTVPELNHRIEELIDRGQAKAYTYPVAGSVFLPPLPASPKFFTARGNSALHTRTRQFPICKQPVMEQRYNFNLAGHMTTSVIKDGFKGFGWNYEMVVVIGKPCHGRNVKKIRKTVAPQRLFEF